MLKRQELRRRILAIRDELGQEQVDCWSNAICDRLGAISEIAEAKVLMAYAPIRNEVDLTPFWLAAWQQGKTIVLPKVQDGELEAIRFTGWENTVPGPFGIKEPVGEPFAPDEIDAVLVPGVVFDTNCFRLGYGKGFYDRFLPGLRDGAFRCGVGYKFQLVEDVFPNEHDVQLDLVVTER